MTPGAFKSAISYMLNAAWVKGRALIGEQHAIVVHDVSAGGYVARCGAWIPHAALAHLRLDDDNLASVTDIKCTECSAAVAADVLATGVIP